MAEIKSTMDLIMERTKNMTMSDEEKQALHQKELQGKAKGWMQRYEDGQISLGTLKEYFQEYKNDRQTILSILKNEAFSRIDPNEDNKRMLQLLSDVLGEDTQPIANRIDTFRKDRQRQMTRHLKKMLQALAEKDIRGSAVIPNVDRDEAWQAWLATAKASFTAAFDAARMILFLPKPAAL